MKKISIITVTFNCKNTIEATIKSVIAQKYDNYEYIIIDGASTDGTVDIIKKYEDYLACFISEQDNGIYDAMNKGLDAAIGEYVYFLNSDDTLESNALRNVAEYLQYTDADVVYGEVLYGRNGNYRLYETLPIECIDWMMPICHQSVFMKKKGRKFDLSYRIAADYNLLNEMYNKHCSFQYIPCLVGTFKAGGESDDWHRTGMEITDIACKAMLKYKKMDRITFHIITKKYIDIVNRNLFVSGDNHAQVVEFVKDYIDNKKNAYIWCTGKFANLLYDIVADAGIKIDGVIDNSYKGKKVFHGHTVEAPDILLKKKNCTIIILSDRYCEEIKEQINDMGIDSSVDVYDFKNANSEYLSRYWDELVERGRKISISFDRYMRMMNS